jgi:ADP-ribose pyrophosphatase YjhB (NUDIX family)
MGVIELSEAEKPVIWGRSNRRVMDPDWLGWVKRLQAIAQEGLTYATDDYDLERYGRLRGIAAEVLAAHSAGDLEEAHALLMLEAGPATPKVDVRAAVFRDGRILLVKEPDDGGWSLPGGWADVGETPAGAAVREVYEESGSRVRALKLIAAYDRDRHGHPPIPYHVYKLVFLCGIEDYAPSLAVDADGVAFFGEHELPELSISRVTPTQIERFFEHHRGPQLPADFD